MYRTVNSPEFARGYGFISEDEQRALLVSSVAIGGVGGDGFHLGLDLVRLGVQRFDIADPQTFEPENANRVPGATTSTYGRLKVDVFEEMARDINPDVDVRKYYEGVTEDNAADFVSRADVVFDETELTELQIGTALARAARARGIPDVMVMNIGFAGQVTSFHPNGRYTFERMMGIPKSMPLDEVKEQKLDLSRCIPKIPAYGDLTTLVAIQEGADLASIAQGVSIASAIGTKEGFLHLTSGVNNHRRKPIWAPRIAYMDSYNFKSGVTRFPRISYYRSLGLAAARDSLGLNPVASYSESDRLRRETARQYKS